MSQLVNKLRRLALSLRLCFKPRPSVPMIEHCVLGQLAGSIGTARKLQTRQPMPSRAIPDPLVPRSWVAFWLGQPPRWLRADSDFDLVGFGRSPDEAFDDLEQNTCDAWAEYVETDEPLTTDAQKLRNWLLEHFEAVQLEPGRRGGVPS